MIVLGVARVAFLAALAAAMCAMIGGCTRACGDRSATAPSVQTTPPVAGVDLDEGEPAVAGREGEIQRVGGRDDAGSKGDVDEFGRPRRPIARAPTVFEEEPPADERSVPADLPGSAQDTAGETLAPPRGAEGTPIVTAVDAGPRPDAPEPPRDPNEDEDPLPIPTPGPQDAGVDAAVIEEPTPGPVLDAGVPVPSQP